MKTFSKSIITPLLLAVVALAACNKNNSSNTSTAPKATSQLTFQLAAVPSADSTGAPVDSVPSIAGLVWSAGTANIGRFDFSAKRAGVSIDIQSRNLTNVDLFALTPLVTYVTLDTGVYKQIEIKAFLEGSNDTIPALKISGSFTNDSSKVVPITFSLTDNAVVQVGASNIDINGTTDYTALLDMQLNKVTKGITAADLNKAKVTNGTIVISRSSNSLLYYKMRANIAGCGRSFFRWHHR